eukprot:scaffold107_cov106-Isochrysis_galbana.AAC.18
MGRLEVTGFDDTHGDQAVSKGGNVQPLPATEALVRLKSAAEAIVDVRCAHRCVRSPFSTESGPESQLSRLSDLWIYCPRQRS